MENENISSFVCSSIGNIQLVKLYGENATIQLAQDFRNCVSDLIERQGSKIIVDLSEAQLMDSTFLGALVVSYRKAKEKNGDILLAGMSEGVKLTFGLTKLINIFRIFDSVDDAVREFEN